MDKLSWLLNSNEREIERMVFHVVADNAYYDKTTWNLNNETFAGWVSLFNICKFWLHYFNQGMKSAWPTKRRALPKAMLNLREGLIKLMKDYSNYTNARIRLY